MEDRTIGVANAVQLHSEGMALLEQARAITGRAGENAGSMAEIGDLLRVMSQSGVLDELLAIRPGAGKRAAVDVIAQHRDGSSLSLYVMEDWQSPPQSDVHWHNYWQVLLVMEGSWPDTIWKPVTRVARGTALDVTIDREETIAAGELQKLGPNEPHGWLADQTRYTDKATLLMWSASAAGRPRVVLDPETGRLVEEFGFLNPQPGANTDSGGEQVGGGSSTASWSRY